MGAQAASTAWSGHGRHLGPLDSWSWLSLCPVPMPHWQGSQPSALSCFCLLGSPNSEPLLGSWAPFPGWQLLLRGCLAASPPVGAMAEGLCRWWERSFPAEQRLTRTAGCSAAILSPGSIPGGSGVMLREPISCLPLSLPVLLPTHCTPGQLMCGVRVWDELGGMGSAE